MFGIEKSILEQADLNRKTLERPTRRKKKKRRNVESSTFVNCDPYLDREPYLYGEIKNLKR